jgi:hypothetical protein
MDEKNNELDNVLKKSDDPSEGIEERRSQITQNDTRTKKQTQKGPNEKKSKGLAHSSKKTLADILHEESLSIVRSSFIDFVSIIRPRLRMKTLVRE